MSDWDGYFHPRLFNFPARLGPALELGLLQEGKHHAGRDLRDLLRLTGLFELDYVPRAGPVTIGQNGVSASSPLSSHLRNGFADRLAA